MIQTFFIWNVIYSMVFIGVFLFISIFVLLRHNKMMNKEKYQSNCDKKILFLHQLVL